MDFTEVSAYGYDPLATTAGGAPQGPAAGYSVASTPVPPQAGLPGPAFSAGGVTVAWLAVVASLVLVRFLYERGARLE